MKPLLLALILIICCAGRGSAASWEELTPYLVGEYFSWEEHHNGRRLLRESGPLFGGGVRVGFVTDFSLTLRGKGEIFGGEVGYRGETQAPDPVPVHTDVSYFGTRQEFDLGYRLPARYLGLEPFAGIGYRWWLRGLQDTSSGTGQRVSGYTELWQTGYGRIGARGRYLTASGVALYAEGGAKYPFYTGNSVDFVNSGTTTFHPGGRWSAFGEAGLSYRNLKLAASYEGFAYSQSPLKLVGTKFYFQPESSSDIVGLSVGWAFR